MKHSILSGCTRGFTLIEVMVVVAIIGILAAIALPAYQDHIIRSRLPEAFTLLDSGRVRMEQQYADVRSYATKRGGNECPSSDKIKNTFASSKYFDIAFEGVCSDNNYKLVATGKNGMENFIYTLDSKGTRATTSLNGGWTAASPTLKCSGDNKDGWIAKKGGICY